MIRKVSFISVAILLSISAGFGRLGQVKMPGRESKSLRQGIEIDWPHHALDIHLHHL
jgi:hypothetical protein